VNGRVLALAPAASSLSVRSRLEAVLAPEIVAALEQLVAEVVAAELAAIAGEASMNKGTHWLTLEQAAARLGCSRDAVRMRANRGRLETRRMGRSVYVSAESVDRLGGGA
jgi:excisionase family DNA binding protein